MKYGYYEYNDLPSSYKNQAKCGICENLDLTKTRRDYYGKTTYYCKAHKDYVKMDKGVCSDTQISKSNYARLGTYRPSGCYITTIVCEILGYEDNCEILSVMREFRDTFLKTRIEYIPVLLEYDQVGPVISECLRNDENRKRIALEAMQNYLLPCGEAYKNGDPEGALNIYLAMIAELKRRYGLETFTVDVTVPYDIDTVGKGRCKINKEVPVV